MVVRINEYKIKGFEEIVGTKTDLWVLGGTRKWDWSNCPRVWLCYPWGCYDREREIVEPYLKKRKNEVI